MQKILIALTALAAAFIVFLLGAVITHFKVFPYGYFRDAFLAAEALLAEPQEDKRENLYLGAKPFHPEDAEMPEIRWDTPGVTRYDPARAFNGYTVYTPVRSNFPIRLADMQGDTLWEWNIDWDAFKGERLDGSSLRIDADVAGQGYLGLGEPTLFPNGDMLLVVNTAWFTPWGAGLMKVDKIGAAIWSYTRQVHHEVSVAPDGRIYALTHEVINEPWPGLETIQTPFLDDFVAVLSPDGEELQYVSVLEAIQGSPWESLLMYADPVAVKGDLLHVNSIFYLQDKHAAFIPGAEAGDVLLSLRNLDVLAVMDLDDTTIKWAARGPWRLQHDADVLDNGNLLLFDNRGDLANGGTSRILEVNPRSLEIVWEYPGAGSDERLYTSFLGSQKRLRNGNTLISESNNGRILEVTPDRDVVWEYRVPEMKSRQNDQPVATVVFSNRFLPGELEFLTGSGNSP
ncbi:MAG: hypothetical protein HKN56_10250 [Gammaproteobacteria bacterium]|nr:hypothetical protein [Gammaproteobacteria bacterium]